MRALTLGDDGLSLRTDYPEPDLESPPETAPIRDPADWALVRLRLAGICSTDLELVKGYYGYRGVLGHEFVGTVEASAASEWVGKRVVGSINLACRECPTCYQLGGEHCPHRSVLGIVAHDGAFADLLMLPVANLLEVPTTVSDEAAVFTEPLAAALRIREQIRVPASERLAVVGPGRLGLLIAQVLALGGARVTVLGRRPESLELPTRWGLDTGLVGDAPSDGFDFVVEATGNEAGLAESLRLVRPLGTLVLKSTFAGAPGVDLTKLVVGELTVVGSRCGPFAPALALLEREAVDVLPLVHGEFALDDGLAAFERAAQPGVLKVLLRP